MCVKVRRYRPSRTMSFGDVIEVGLLTSRRSCLGKSRLLGDNMACARNICAGAKIVVSSQAIAAQMQLVYSALDDRLVLSALIAGGFTRLLAAGRDVIARFRFNCVGFRIDPAGDHQHA